MDKTIINFAKLKRDDQKCVIEALIFSSEEVLPMKTIISFLSGLDGMDTNGKEQSSIDEEIIAHHKITPELIIELIKEINDELVSTNRPFRLVNVAGGWQYATRSEYGELVAKLVKSKSKRRLSQKTLETLAIIAYKQPISKPEIDQIRGVHSGELVNSLLDRGLVRIIGRSDALGKPLLYGTTDDFLKTFGINSLEDLPKLRDIGEFTESQGVTELEIIIDKMEDAPLDRISQLQKKIDEGIDVNDYVFDGKTTGN